MSTCSEQSTGSYSTYDSSSSSMEQEVSEAVVPLKNHQNPEWIEELLEARFFVACPTHPYIGNHLNKYCVICEISGCQFCFSSSSNRHPNHEILKVYRHVYREAVLVSQMANYLDCSQIMPYKSNRSLVIALMPHPHLSGVISKFRCQTCGRRVNPQYSYCCLHCKVAAMVSKSKGASSSAPPCLGDQTSPDKGEQKKRVVEPEDSLRRRKGKPFRAPFA